MNKKKFFNPKEFIKIDPIKVQSEMEQLQDKIDFKFKDIRWLEKAMCCVKFNKYNHSEKNNDNCNDTLATVGDSILSMVICDKLFTQKTGISKREITIKKQQLENNSALHNIVMKYEIINHAHNDKYFYTDENVPIDEQVVHNKHDSYLEAIIGAIYYDSGFRKVKKWINTWLLPKLDEKIKQSM